MQGELNEALASWKEWSDYEPRLICELQGGRSNRSFKIRCGLNHYLLRLNNPKAENLGVDRRAELKIQRAAAKAGIAPRVIFAAPQWRFVISEFIEGRTWQAADLLVEENRSRLTALISTIQSLKVEAPTLNLNELIESYWKQIPTTIKNYHQLNRQRLELLKSTQGTAPFSGQITLCHNDLLPSNLIERNDGQLMAIDWEYAAMGDPAFELAVVESRLSEKNWRLNMSSTITPDALKSAKACFQLIETLWTLIAEP